MWQEKIRLCDDKDQAEYEFFSKCALWMQSFGRNTKVAL